MVSLCERFCVTCDWTHFKYKTNNTRGRGVWRRRITRRGGGAGVGWGSGGGGMIRGRASLQSFASILEWGKSAQRKTPFAPALSNILASSYIRRPQEVFWILFLFIKLHIYLFNATKKPSKMPN